MAILQFPQPKLVEKTGEGVWRLTGRVILPEDGSLDRAAALLGLSEAAVYNLVHTEGFPAIQPGGGKWIINRARLQDWLDKQLLGAEI